MPRPKKCRRVCSLPQSSGFDPVGCPSAGVVVMAVDEFETIRLIDLLGYTQEKVAEQMGVARTTIQAVYSAARYKLADALVNGKTLQISGGDYAICPRATHCSGGQCGRHRHCSVKQNTERKEEL